MTAYLLHFDFINTAMSRAVIEDRLTRKLERKYRGNDEEIYQHLAAQQATALKVAQRLDRHWVENHGRCVPEQCNPSTNVHGLVAFLNQLVELGAGA